MHFVLDLRPGRGFRFGKWWEWGDVSGEMLCLNKRAGIRDLNYCVSVGFGGRIREVYWFIG